MILIWLYNYNPGYKLLYNIYIYYYYYYFILYDGAGERFHIILYIYIYILYILNNKYKLLSPLVGLNFLPSMGLCQFDHQARRRARAQRGSQEAARELNEGGVQGGNWGTLRIPIVMGT